ncbi:MAG: hypothetical protein KF903_04790 [Dokdonella sp.]|uniref:hypothetical protein n=3 Tax=Dokdonella sp. TaxID=2291710 RepID=UPI0025BB3BE7|nr:hypothetical protein [Dokdonella sp.]MBX3700299.1 hypothetical protein [Dokdonella sp.]
MRLESALSTRCLAAMLLGSCLIGTSAQAQEVCGLQDVNFDSIFINGFDSATTGGGIGPPASTTPPPTLGITPAIAITWPTAGTVLPAGKVQVVGTVTGSINTGVSVAGTRAYVNNGVFVTPEITLDSTVTSLAATATTMDGLTASANVSVTASTTEPDASLSTATPVGFSPLPVQFHLGVKTGLTLQSVAVDFDGNGSTDYTGTTVGDLPIFSYPVPGAYTATASLTFTGHAPVTVKHRVMVVALAEQRTAICSTYAHLRARLGAQDVTGAGYALMGDLKSRLTPLFTALGTRMPTVAANLGILADGTIGFDAADIIAVRDLTSEVRGYPVHFARDANGVWRIDSM